MTFNKSTNSNKKHYASHRPLLSSSILNALKILSRDVKNSIQYDHISSRITRQDLFSIRKQLVLIVKDIYINMESIDNGKIVEYINRKFENIHDINKTLVAMIEKHNNEEVNGLNVSEFTFNVFQKVNVNLDNHKTIQYAFKVINSFLNKEKEIKKILNDKTYSLYVPKNSDKASNDFRTMSVKPLINEILLTAILIQANVRITENKNLEYSEFFPTNKKVHIFGSRVLAHDRNKTSSYLFSNYIHEYDNYTVKIKEAIDINKYQFAAGLDISKYFDNIVHRDVAEALWKPYSAYTKYSDSVANKISFMNFVTGLLNYTGNKQGLTIETHTQHALANLTMNNIMKDVNFDNVEVFMYVDDIIILGNNKRDVDHACKVIKATLGIYNHTFSAVKETKTFNIGHNGEVNKFKELVRLPGNSYMDIPVINPSMELRGKFFEFVKYLIATNIIDAHGNVCKNEYNARDIDYIIKSVSGFMNDMNLVNFNNESSVPAIRTLVKNLMIVLASKFTDKKYNLQHGGYAFTLTSNFSWRIKSVNKYKKEGKLDIAQVASFKMRDAVYFAVNYQKFVFTKMSSLELVKKLENEEISVLEVLQHFYLTWFLNDNRNSANEEFSMFMKILNALAVVIIVKYPSKIKFLASIYKTHVSRMYNRMNAISGVINTSYCNEYDTHIIKIVTEINHALKCKEVLGMKTDFNTYLSNKDINTVAEGNIFYFNYRMLKDTFTFEMKED